VTARVRNFLTRLVVGAYMPRSIKVVLTVIGFVVATTVLGTIEQVTGCLGLSQACPPLTIACPAIQRWCRLDNNTGMH
jgi:hypothetical protein